MIIAKCEECNNKFKYSQTIKFILGIKSGLICEKCGKKYKVSILSKIIISVLAGLIPIMGYNFQGEVSKFIALLVGYILIVIFMSPFFITFRKDN